MIVERSEICYPSLVKGRQLSTVRIEELRTRKRAYIDRCPHPETLRKTSGPHIWWINVDDYYPRIRRLPVKVTRASQT